MFKRALSSAQVFNSENAAKQDIVDAGQTILLELYNSRGVDCLDKLRYKTFMEKVGSGRSAVEPKYLPVTLDAATQHFFHSYYQVQQWLNREAINPLEWRWRVLSEAMWPVGMVNDPAPEELLELTTADAPKRNFADNLPWFLTLYNVCSVHRGAIMSTSEGGGRGLS